MPWCQLQFFFFLWNFICLKGRERTEPKISGLLLFPQMPVLAGVKARNQELIPGLQYGWEGSKYLQHHLLALRMCISNKLVSEVEPGHRPRLSNRDMGIPGGVFTVVPSADSYCLFFPPCWPHQTWMEFLIKNLIHWGIALNTLGGGYKMYRYWRLSINWHSHVRVILVSVISLPQWVYHCVIGSFSLELEKKCVL